MTHARIVMRARRGSAWRFLGTVAVLFFLAGSTAQLPPYTGTPPLKNTRRSVLGQTHGGQSWSQNDRCFTFCSVS
jgi:hypothetical protein